MTRDLNIVGSNTCCCIVCGSMADKFQKPFPVDYSHFLYAFLETKSFCLPNAGLVQ